MNEPETVEELLSRCGAERELLLPLLREVVQRVGFVPPQTLVAIAGHFNLSRAEVFGVVSFYHDLRDTPAGRQRIRICLAEACQAVGCRALAEHAEIRLGIRIGATSADGAVTLESAYCFGNCALGPTVSIDDVVFGRVDAARFDALVAPLRIETRPR